MATKQKDSDQLEPGDGNVEQIREILFGGHIRAFDDRFDLVEARLGKETDALRKAIEKRVLELEHLVKSFSEDASDRQDTESNDRALALNKLEIALGQSRVDAENQMAAMEDNSTAEMKQIREEMKAMHKELAAALAKADRELSKRSENLTEDKVARRDLAEMLKGLAEGLYPEKKTRGK